MQKKLFLAVGCIFALMFAACGTDEDETSIDLSAPGVSDTPAPVTKTFCERMAEETTWSEFECEETVGTFGACSNQYKAGMTCLLDLNRSYVYSLENMKKECPGKYLELVDCANKNGGKMTVPDYCDKHKAKCGYVTEILSTCIGDYSRLECAEYYTGWMDCALTNTTLECIDEGYSESSYTSAVVQDTLAKYCVLPALAYAACMN